MRQGFSQFFGELKTLAEENGVGLRCITFQARRHAYEKFCYGLQTEPNALHVLLVDAEAPVATTGACWAHVAFREGDNWPQPDAATDDNIHFMAQAVEAWFFADPDALAAYYGQKFNKSALPKTSNVEDIPTAQHIPQLEAATKATQKGRYDKTDHAPDLLGRVDPTKVRTRAPHCDRLFETLRAKIMAAS